MTISITVQSKWFDTCLAASLICFLVSGLPQAHAEDKRALAPDIKPAQSAVLDLVSFNVEIRNLQTKLEGHPSAKSLSEIRRSLPPIWTVKTAKRTYSITTGPLEALLTPGLSDKAAAWLRHFGREVQGAEDSDIQTTGARQELDRILARREFAALAPPSAWDRFRQRIAQWLDRIILRILSGIAHHPMGGEILFWLLVLAAVAFAALCVVRFITRHERAEPLPAATLAKVQTWQEWLRAARFAADRGDYRQAVHSVYWAGIVRLEDTGAVPRDRSKTPREYLCAIGDVGGTGFGSPQNGPASLLALTTALERIWYADRGAGPDEFADSLRHLEALGCPLA
jgi:Domain of unknown function (DUF4129)